MSSQYQSRKYHVGTTDVVESFPPDIHCNLISFLTLVQRLNFDFIPAMWNALESNEEGGTAKVNVTTIDAERRFLFKRISALFAEDRTKAFRALISEVFVLGNPLIRHHPNIVDLEGICWEIDKHENVTPVLVFQEAPRGSLDTYFRSAEGREASFDTRLKLCLDIGSAIACLHSASTCFPDT